MRIESRKLKVITALSEETTCYTVEVWIDGAKAFVASNRGHGAADDFHQVGTVTERSVDAWLAANRPSTRIGDTVLDHTLEFEVAALIGRIEEDKRLRRAFMTQLIAIDEGKVYSYALKGRNLSFVAAAARRQRPWRRVVNGDEQALEEAIDSLWKPQMAANQRSRRFYLLDP